MEGIKSDERERREDMKPIVTYEVAHAAGTDAANRSMLAAGRTGWNREDYQRAVEEFVRLMPEGVKDEKD